MRARLEVTAEADFAADREIVWSLLSDANTFAVWGPWNDGGYRPPSAGPSTPGSIQWFRFGRRTVSVEEVLEVEPPHKLVYAVIDGLPVRNYRAEVTLTATDSQGTKIRWTATWDNTFLGRIVHRKLTGLYPHIVDALGKAAEQRPTTQREIPPTTAP